MSPVKIVYVIGGLGTGGAERQLLYLAHGMAPRAAVTVVSLSVTDPDLLAEFRARGIRVVTCAKRARFDLTLIPRLVALFHRERPTIVHSYLRTANYWARVAAMLAGVPIRIASERNVEVERGRVANSVDRLLALASDRIVVNAEAIRDRLINVEGIATSKIEVIQNGVPLGGSAARDVGKLRRDMALDYAPQLIAFVGRLVPQKNPRLFLDMARLLLESRREIGFIVVGDGEMRDRLEAETEACGLRPAIRFLGHRPDVVRILEVVDVLVLSSDWEGLPNVILEAFAVGVPVVATDVGGVRELVCDGVSGFVVPPGDAECLAERVRRLVDDPALRADLGSRGRRDARERFSVETMIARTAVMYDRVLEPRGLPRLAAVR